MKKNIGKTDRLLRLIVATGIIVLYFTGILPGTVAIVLGVVVAVLILTSFFNFCPLYKLIGINTRRQKV